jgi:hypothetical protein
MSACEREPRTVRDPHASLSSFVTIVLARRLIFARDEHALEGDSIT